MLYNTFTQPHRAALRLVYSYMESEMIRCFRKSIITVSAIAAAALLICIYVLFFKSFATWWLRLVTAAIVALIGIFAARTAGNIVASSENTKLLGLLFHEMKPAEFIEAYRPVAEKTDKKSFDGFASYAYLADGYSAAGNPTEAIRIIDEAFAASGRSTRLRPYYMTNRLRYLIAAGRYVEADDELEALLQAIGDAGSTLRANIEKNTLPMKEFLDAYLRGSTDYSSLEDEMNYSKVLTSKLEAAFLVRVLRERNGESTKDADRIIALYPKYRGGIDQSKR